MRFGRSIETRGGWPIHGVQGSGQSHRPCACPLPPRGHGVCNPTQTSPTPIPNGKLKLNRRPKKKTCVLGHAFRETPSGGWPSHELLISDVFNDFGIRIILHILRRAHILSCARILTIARILCRAHILRGALHVSILLF